MSVGTPIATSIGDPRGDRNDEADLFAVEGGYRNYRPLPGIHDEMVDQEGRVRTLWRPLVDRIAGLSRVELDARTDRAQRYLSDAGVFYKVYGSAQTTERDWPLSTMPLLLSETEWSSIAEGIIQRAELLERLAADIYGENRLVREGLLPPSLIASNPEFLRPMVGVRPADGHFLHFCAFELGRGPDGRWWVLGDRTQAPSGAGFALENRVATTRAFADVSAEMHVHRLAGFFRDFRDRLRDMAAITARDPERRVAVITPGPHNETYFEHAYIARYLGFLLLQGEDLTVVDGRMMVRTVGGPKPIGVLWRRMDAAFMDPLELNQSSRIGTPGFVDALRAGSVSVVNALGTGILETRALMAFLPALSHRLLGEDLKLDNVATWWCGHERERRHVIERLEERVVGPAFSTMLAFEDAGATLHGRALNANALSAMREWLERDGEKLVGQEAVTLSTTPAFIQGELQPRPFSLRVFAARTARGWQVMHGGFARIGQSLDPTAITMQRGGSAADVWVVSERPVDAVTLLPQWATTFSRASPASLHSRAADNLFWLGRYTQRAEDEVRMLRAYHGRLAEAVRPDAPLLLHLAEEFEDIGLDIETAIPEGLIATLDSALRAAGQVRERFSPDGWLALNDLARTARAFAERVSAGDDTARAMTVLLRKLAGFAGLIHENMYRFMGWRFLKIGRALERAIHMTRLTRQLTCLGEDEASPPDGAHDMLLEIGDSVLTHRRRYTVSTRRETVIDLMALDELNPRSILFQINDIRDELEHLPGIANAGTLSPLAESALRLQGDLRLCQPGDMDRAAFDRIENQIYELSNLFNRSYFS